jgi:CDP-diacylglycerol--glycerol-3-phosphate 3-phosphatidyltransferase
MSAIELRQLPNLISAARLACVPLLAYLAYAGSNAWFTSLLIAALISDIVDGMIARRFGLCSDFGSLLDSIADVSTLCVAIYGITVFHPAVLHAHWIASLAMIGSWGMGCVLALLRYGRLSSFHTYTAKIAAYLLGIFIGVLFLSGFQPWLFYLAVVVSDVGNIEEMLLLWLLPEWRADVRGLWWVLRKRRQETGG